MSDQKSPPAASIQVQIDERTSKGNYVNLARISHSQHEFVVDAMFLPPQTTNATVAARLIMSPAHAQQLLQALQQNLALYERRYGSLKPIPPGDPNGNPNFN